MPKQPRKLFRESYSRRVIATIVASAAATAVADFVVWPGHSGKKQWSSGDAADGSQKFHATARGAAPIDVESLKMIQACSKRLRYVYLYNNHQFFWCLPDMDRTIYSIPAER